jgi:UDP:flavonoid glycosyltransferase YjiC (YdhE family)
VPERLDVIVVTWQGGGATNQALGLVRLLADRGHRVRVLAPALVAGRVAAAGGEHRPFPRELEYDATAGRAMEEQWTTYLPMMFWGAPPVEAVREELAARPADVVVVDQLLRSASWWVARHGPPLVVLAHMAHRYHGVVVDPGSDVWGVRWQYALVADAFAAAGADGSPSVPEPVESMTVSLARAAAATIVALPREIDPWPDAPASVTHVGLLREEVVAQDRDPLAGRWPDDDRRPLVVVSLGTTYMHQEDALRRIGAALAMLDVRVLVLTGHELGPAEVGATLGGAARVLGYVPHASVLPGAALIVTHAGVGTMLEAMAAGVPAAYFPLGRDQHDNADLGEELGVGVALADDAEGAELAATLAAAMGSTELRDSTAALARRLAVYDPGRAVAAVETAARILGPGGTRRRPVRVERAARRAGAARTSVTGP